MTGTLKPVANVKIASLPEVIEQIGIRRKLIDDMVGQLYPSILWGEIIVLEQRRRDLIEAAMNG